MYKKATHYNKTFSPIRMMLNLPDDKWNQFINDDRTEILGATEAVFAINEIFPFGVLRYEEELGKFMADIDTIQVTLSFLKEFTFGKAGKAIFDLRISIQNFAMFLSVRSYISAFQSFRKMLEGILWVKEILSSDKVPAEITRWEYKELLDDINPKFGELYSKLNKVFHFKKSKPLNFNLNVLYNQEESLNDLLESVTDVADDYVKFINKLIKESKDPIIKRYSQLVSKLEKARESYHLTNMPIKRVNGAKMYPLEQNIYAQLILDDTDKGKLKYFLDGYGEGLEELMYAEWEKPFHMSNLYYVWQELKEYDDNFRFFGPMLNDSTINSKHISEKQQTMLIRDGRILHYRKYINKLKETTINVFEKEIHDTDIDYLRLKSILEDIAASFSVNKVKNYSLLLYLISYIDECFNIKIQYQVDIVRFKHILTDDRVRYIDNEGNKEGEVSNDYFYELLDDVLDTINDHIRNDNLQ